MNNQAKTLIAILTVAVISLLVIVAYSITNKNKKDLPTPTPTITPTATATLPPTVTATPTITVTMPPTSSVTPTVPPTSSVYENSYMKITVPSTWTYTTTANGSINIMKDNYILFINPNYQQASGVQGGRFEEIASGAPSADAIIKVKPSGPCGSTVTTLAYSVYKRKDLYVKNSDASETCAAPTTNSSVWYFSYVVDNDGYLSYYKTVANTSYVITMSYNSKNVNSFPVKDSSALNAKLNEMTNIVKTLQLKRQ